MFALISRLFCLAAVLDEMHALLSHFNDTTIPYMDPDSYVVITHDGKVIKGTAAWMALYREMEYVYDDRHTTFRNIFHIYHHNKQGVPASELNRHYMAQCGV